MERNPFFQEIFMILCQKIELLVGGSSFFRAGEKLMKGIEECEAVMIECSMGLTNLLCSTGQNLFPFTSAAKDGDTFASFSIGH